MAAVAMKHMASNFVKLDKFEGVDFRRWQKKMHFLLSSMSMVYVLTTPIPKDGGDDATVKQIRKRAKMLNLLKNYEIPWRPNIWLRMHQKEFKHTLKHLREELTLVELGSHLRIKESLRVQDSDKPKGNNVAGPSVVNMVEHNNSSRYNDNKGKRKHHNNTRANPNKKAKPTCWKCGKTCHTKRDCKCVNVSNKANDLGTKGSVDGSSNSLKGAIVHVCKDRCWFKTYESLNDESILHMRNESTALVHGHGCVDLRTESRVLGAVVRLPNPKLKTLGERGIECIFVGYAEHSKAFRFSSDSRPSLKIPNGTKDIGGSVVPEEITKEVVRQIEPELRESKRNRTQKDFGPQFQLYLIEGTKDKGFKQKSGIVYFDTYAPVARISTIRLLIAMASIHNLIILHMDVKTAFLNCELDEEVYINQPQGLIMRSNENKVYKLIKSLYRLKQAPKQWHQKFDEVVLSNGYLLNQANKCVAALSQRIEIGDKGLDHNRISRIRFLNHSDSLPVAAKATNSDFIVEPVMQVCFLEA
ncbi:zinc finger, CCHC-type containing protein [Tanacetum coccineum]